MHCIQSPNAALRLVQFGYKTVSVYECSCCCSVCVYIFFCFDVIIIVLVFYVVHNEIFSFRIGLFRASEKRQRERRKKIIWKMIGLVGHGYVHAKFTSFLNIFYYTCCSCCCRRCFFYLLLLLLIFFLVIFIFLFHCIAYFVCPLVYLFMYFLWLGSRRSVRTCLCWLPLVVKSTENV